MCPWIPAFEIQIFLTPKTLELPGKCGVIYEIHAPADREDIFMRLTQYNNLALSMHNDILI